MTAIKDNIICRDRGLAVTKKYRLTSETKLHLGRTLHRIEAVINLKFAREGERGG